MSVYGTGAASAPQDLKAYGELDGAVQVGMLLPETAVVAVPDNRGWPFQPAPEGAGVKRYATAFGTQNAYGLVLRLFSPAAGWRSPLPLILSYNEFRNMTDAMRTRALARGTQPTAAQLQMAEFRARAAATTARYRERARGAADD